jgi:hypothetical protein
MPSVAFFETRSENAVSASLHFSSAAALEKWRGILPRTGTSNFSRCPCSGKIGQIFSNCFYADVFGSEALGDAVLNARRKLGATTRGSAVPAVPAWCNADAAQYSHSMMTPTLLPEAPVAPVAAPVDAPEPEPTVP